MEKFFYGMLKACMVVCMVATPISALSSWEVGMHNTRYLFGKLIVKDRLVIGLRQSVFSQDLKFQQTGVSVGWRGEVAAMRLEYDAECFGATEWNGGYQVMWTNLSVRVSPLWRFSAEGSIQCNYDTGYGYDTCFSGGVGYSFSGSIEGRLSYTTIPELRQSERRVRLGVRIRSGSLWVYPLISLPVKGYDTLQNLRILVGFGYRFGH